MRPILRREFSFHFILGFCTASPFSILEVSHPHTLLSLLRCGVEEDIIEDESLEEMFSARLSSRNCSPIYLVERFFLFCNLTLSSAAAAAAAAAFRGDRVLPGFLEGNDFPMHAWRRFNVVRILWTILVIFHGRHGRFWTHIIEILFLLRNNERQCSCPYCSFHRSPLWFMCTALRWRVGWECFFSPFTSAASEELSTLESVLVTFSGMYSYFWMWRMSINAAKCTFLAFLLWCAFHKPSFQSFFTVAFPSGINIGWSEKSFVCASDLQSLLNHTKLSIPEVRWSEQHSEYVLVSFHVHTWEYLVLTGFFWGVTWRIVSQIRCAARQDNVCLLSPSTGIMWRASLRIFSSERICEPNCNTTQNSVFSCNINTKGISFCPRCFFPIVSPHRRFLLEGVSFNNINLVK